MTVEQPPLADRVRAARLPPADERRAIRVAAKVSLQEIADELGVTNGSVCRWEQGATEPKRDVAIRYARLLADLRDAVS